MANYLSMKCSAIFFPVSFLNVFERRPGPFCFFCSISIRLPKSWSKNKTRTEDFILLGLSFSP